MKTRHTFSAALVKMSMAAVAVWFATGICTMAQEAAPAAQPAGDVATELAKKLANPVADLISVPFQYNYDEFGGVNEGASKSVLNIQPIIPFSLGEDWNLIIRTIVPLTVAKSGCQAWTVARDASDPNRVRYSEIWHSESAFQKHAQSDDFRRVLVAMDMCCGEPRVVIGNLSGRSGMAYLQELRAKNVSED